MAVVISDQVLKTVELSGDELLIELACFLYKTKRLSSGKCRNLANLSHIEFQKELSKREIDRHYSQEDLDLDLKNLGVEL